MMYEPLYCAREASRRKKRKKKRNTAMFREIADVIELNPHRHHQPSWSSADVRDSVIKLPTGTKTVSCGTTQCVAGWAVALDEENYGINHVGAAFNYTTNTRSNFTEAGADILGLSETEANRLFFHYSEPPMGWPRALRAIGEGIDIQEALTTIVPTCCKCEETND